MNFVYQCLQRFYEVYINSNIIAFLRLFLSLLMMSSDFPLDFKTPKDLKCQNCCEIYLNLRLKSNLRASE